MSLDDVIQKPLVVTLGESLIDQVVKDDGTVENIVGGSPLNTALALSRQGIHAALASRISNDDLGKMILDVLSESSVDVSRVAMCDVPPTRAIATPDGRGGMKYAFDIAGTTQGTWSTNDLENVCTDADYIVVTAALAATVEGMNSAFDSFMTTVSGEKNDIIVFDPNVRPALIEDVASVKKLLSKWISLSDVVKASAEDVEHCWPNMTWEEVANEWLSSGAKLVVITDGDQGAHAFSKETTIFVEAVKIDPLAGGDTIGAGDTFTAGLIKFFIDNSITDADQINKMSDAQLKEAILAGTLLAGETCKRVGANPPWADNKKLAEV